MKCSIRGCPGKYEKKLIVYTLRYQGQVTVIYRVPAEICSVCGDVLLKPEAVRRHFSSFGTYYKYLSFNLLTISR